MLGSCTNLKRNLSKMIKNEKVQDKMTVKHRKNKQNDESHDLKKIQSGCPQKNKEQLKKQLTMICDRRIKNRGNLPVSMQPLIAGMGNQKYQVVSQMLAKQKKQFKTSTLWEHSTNIYGGLLTIASLCFNHRCREKVMCLAFCYFKQYISRHKLQPHQSNKIAVACLSLANKYQESADEKSKFFVESVQNMSTEQLKQKQFKVMIDFNLNLNRVTSLDFLQLIQSPSTPIYCFANYLIQLFCILELADRFKPSLLAYSAYKIAASILKVPQKFSLVPSIAKFSFLEVSSCMFKIIEVVNKQTISQINSLRQTLETENLQGAVKHQ